MVRGERAVAVRRHRAARGHINPAEGPSSPFGFISLPVHDASDHRDVSNIGPAGAPAAGKAREKEITVD